MVAMLFILFDVEAVFLYPWAVILRELKMFGFWEMLVYIGIVLVGFFYVWKKGVLDWGKPLGPPGRSVMPAGSRHHRYRATEERTRPWPDWWPGIAAAVEGGEVRSRRNDDLDRGAVMHPRSLRYAAR